MLKGRTFSQIICWQLDGNETWNKDFEWVVILRVLPLLFYLILRENLGDYLFLRPLEPKTDVMEKPTELYLNIKLFFLNVRVPTYRCKCNYVIRKLISCCIFGHNSPSNKIVSWNGCYSFIEWSIYCTKDHNFKFRQNKSFITSLKKKIVIGTYLWLLGYK